MTDSDVVDWLTSRQWQSVAAALTPPTLMGPLTYAVFYAGRLTDDGSQWADVAGLVWATVAGVGLIAGLMCRRCPFGLLLRWSAFATAGLVGGHLVWATAAGLASPALALSNVAELWLALVLAYAARRADDGPG